MGAAGDKAATAKPGAEAKDDFPFVGEVTGSDVYVRCQPDQNWYPTMKLSRGDRIDVCGEQFGWYKIRPPKGSFCYITKTQVVKDTGNKGVVKGQNVYVRAGSSLPEHARTKKCIVIQLDEGAEVTILGDDPDGFYRIAPPEGAFYWVFGKYVRRAGKKVGTAERAEPAEPTTRASGVVERGPAEKAPEPAMPPRLIDVWQKKLDLVDAELNAALRQKPWREEDFLALRERFVPIAQQTEEDVPSAYAKIRLKHIDNILERIAIRKRVNQIGTGPEKRADRAAATQQAEVTPRPAQPDYEGKLVRSFAFEGRYRVVDRTTGKTLVYLEFPQGSGLNPNDFVGRFVKVRTKRKYYDKDAGQNIVEPADIVVADEPLRKLTPPPAEAPRQEPTPPVEAPKRTPKTSAVETTRPAGPPSPQPAASANRPAALDAPEK